MAILRLLLLTLLAFPLALPAPALAAEPARCEDEVWSRPGLTRELRVICFRTDRVRVGAQPQGGTVTGTRFDGWAFTFRLASTADSPAEDFFELELDGPAGSRTQRIAVHAPPRTQNTAPQCWPVTTALRSDGLTPPLVSFDISCFDAERDDVTLHGGGPGTHPASGAVQGPDRSVPKWSYRPTIASGVEQTRYWAIDSLGARSADAPISVMVGPTVDRRPECRPQPAAYASGNRWGVLMRAGASRRFMILCEDLDGDAITPRITAGPYRGALTAFDVGAPQAGWWGMQRFIDVTYTPGSAAAGDETFGVVSSGPHGDGPVTDIPLLVAAQQENTSAGGCGWSPSSTPVGQPVDLVATCGDTEGDPLGVEILDPPLHGSVGAAQATPAAYGEERLAIPYTPAPGFTGTDLVKVRVSDGRSEGLVLDFEVHIDSGQATGPWQVVDGPDDMGWFLSPKLWAMRPPGATQSPASGQPAAIAEVDQARRAFGLRTVRLVSRLGAMRVYAPGAALRAQATVRALAVTCPVRCEVSAKMRLAGRTRKSAIRATPGRARLIAFELTRAQRRAVRSAGGMRAGVRLRARALTGTDRAVRTASTTLRLRPGR